MWKVDYGYFRVFIEIVEPNAVEMQFCKAVLSNHNSSTCLNTTASHFTDMQKYTSTFWIYQRICSSIFPAIFLLFVGAWSDVFGRRPVLLSCSVGNTSLENEFFLEIRISLYHDVEFSDFRGCTDVMPVGMGK